MAEDNRVLERILYLGHGEMVEGVSSGNVMERETTWQ
jgi:hypothetical protein